MTSNTSLILLMILSCVLTSLAMIVPQDSPLIRVRREEGRKYYTKIMTCVRNKLGSSENKEARCVVREMLRVFSVKDSVRCKNCEHFFYCSANFNARKECGDGWNVSQASEAVSQCKDRNEDFDESLSLASTLGRNNGDCARDYLCSSGCKFASSNETCTLTCR